MSENPNLQVALRYKGWVSEPVTFTVCPEKVREFCAALGDAAEAWGQRVPPTFPIVLRDRQRPAIEGFTGARLHGAQEFDYERPLRLGEDLVLQTRVTDVFGKQGSDGRPLTFILFETTATTAAGELVYQARATQIVR